MKNTLTVVLCFSLRPFRNLSVPVPVRRADVLMLPELVDGGYDALARGTGIHRIGDETLESVRRMSAVTGLTAVAGSYVLADRRGRRTNSALVFRRGSLVHRYDKVHLFRPARDHHYFRGGTRIRTFTLRTRRHCLRAGVVLCYDLRFPELIRLMAKRGIRILFVPARWPAVRAAAWRTLLRARAIENQIFVLGCNARGPEGGPSYAFDPLGRPVKAMCRKGRQGTVSFLLDLGALREARRHHNNIKEAVVLKRLAVRNPG